MSQPPLPGKKSQERRLSSDFFRGEAAVTQASDVEETQKAGVNLTDRTFYLGVLEVEIIQTWRYYMQYVLITFIIFLSYYTPIAVHLEKIRKSFALKVRQ